MAGDSTVIPRLVIEMEGRSLAEYGLDNIVAVLPDGTIAEISGFIELEGLTLVDSILQHVPPGTTVFYDSDRCDHFLELRLH